MQAGVAEQFQLLGLKEGCTQAAVLRSWRRLARKHHSDKSGSPDDTRMQALNRAKEQCLIAISERDHRVSEREFVLHICSILGRPFDSDMYREFCVHGGAIIRPRLRQFFWLRTVDAMEWILKCYMGDMEFDQTVEDEIPILCKYYNDFVGADRWDEQDHTMMMVLNMYDRIKARGHGNFARFLCP
jgi:hypothetical protein